MSPPLYKKQTIKASLHGSSIMPAGMWLRCRRAVCSCNLSIIVRAFHTSLILGVASTFIYKETALHVAIWNGDVLYAGGFFIVLIFSLIMYFVACVTDPGYVPIKNNNRKAWEEEEECEEEDASMLVNQEEEGPDGDQEPPLRRCGHCGVSQPLRSRHCEDCGRCVRRYDHHCPWLETCVGERNHKFFWLFLASTGGLIVWGCILVWPCLLYHRVWSMWFKDNAVFLIDLTIMITAGFMTLILFCSHSYLMLCGVTTWELMSRERITYLKELDYDDNPFHEGYFGNMLSFLCKMRVRKWDKLYRKNIKNSLAEEECSL